jgi:glycosyltransferase involved in cell wall biosynthesis
MSQPILLFVDVWTKMFIVHRMGLAKAMQAQGYKVHLASPDGPERQRLEDEGIVFHPIPLKRGSLNPWTEFNSVRALVRVLRELRPNIVHALRLKGIVYGGIAARRAKVPAIVYGTTGLGYTFAVQGMFPAALRMIVKKGLRAALRHPNSCIVVENPDDANTLVQQGIASAGAARVISSGVDLREFPFLPQPQGVPVVVFAARMLWEKGVGEFVAAAKSLKGKGIAARFVLVGELDPDNRSAVPPDQLSAWKRSGIVEYWGWQDNLVEVFAQAAVVCLPSYYREGLPQVLMKAAACGRSIVTTDAPGCREIVRHRQTGLLVPVRDAHSLALALEELIAAPDLRLRMGIEGRALVEREFSQERINAETLKIYRELQATLPA